MEVKVLLDSTNPYTGTRLTTLHCVYPQFIHQQVLTHRMFSRNASSLRAISFDRATDEFELVYPTWTLEKKGMQGEFLEDKILKQQANVAVANMYDHVFYFCEKLKAYGIHHQDINNYLRPFQNIHTVITATDWEGFFQQRLHETTKPDMQKLAQEMKEAIDASESVKRSIHLPLMEDFYNSFLECWLLEEFTLPQLQLISAARLARISYFKWQDDPYKDLELAYKLMQNGHASPFEHIAFAQEDTEYYANFKSWKQLRHVLKV